jgi:hypothetical protein
MDIFVLRSERAFDASILPQFATKEFVPSLPLEGARP